MPSILSSLFLTGLLFFVVLSLLFLRAIHPPRPTTHPPNRKPHLIVLLGSGGHTAEMFSLLRGIPLLSKNFPRRTYVFSTGDWLSSKKAKTFEDGLWQSAKVEGGRAWKRETGSFVIREVPRSRMVGQGWGSVPWSALKTLGSMLRVLHFADGDVLLMNGPGNAVMAVLAILILRMFGKGKVRLVYVESFARVKGLSLSGRLVYPFVDRFLVQWESLVEKYPRAEYRGVLV